MRRGSEVTSAAATLAHAQQKIRVPPPTPLNLQLSLDNHRGGCPETLTTPSACTLEPLHEMAQVGAHGQPSTPRGRPPARTVRRAPQTPRGRARSSDPRWPGPAVSLSGMDSGQLPSVLYLFLFTNRKPRYLWVFSLMCNNHMRAHTHIAPDTVTPPVLLDFRACPRSNARSDGPGVWTPTTEPQCPFPQNRTPVTVCHQWSVVGKGRVTSKLDSRAPQPPPSLGTLPHWAPRRRPTPPLPARAGPLSPCRCAPATSPEAEEPRRQIAES